MGKFTDVGKFLQKVFRFGSAQESDTFVVSDFFFPFQFALFLPEGGRVGAYVQFTADGEIEYLPDDLQSCVLSPLRPSGIANLFSDPLNVERVNIFHAFVGKERFHP